MGYFDLNIPYDTSSCRPTRQTVLESQQRSQSTLGSRRHKEEAGLMSSGAAFPGSQRQEAGRPLGGAVAIGVCLGPCGGDHQPLYRVCHTHHSRPPHGHLPSNTRPACRRRSSSTGLFLSSLNISTSLVTARWNIALSVKNPSKLIPVQYTHMKLQLSFDSQLALSCPSLIPAFTQGPGNVTTVRAKALSMLAIVNDLGVKGLVSALKGGVVTIDVVVKAKRRLHLGPWWVPVFDLYASCMGVTFTAPTDSKGGGDWMILRGTLSCTPDIFTRLCCLFTNEVDAQDEISKKLLMLNLEVWTRSGSTVNRIEPSVPD
ncbi:hypothetical protein NL676_003733 [Syzygium grande]|nr:hypothetical protein NL676_003733 [Syzygium grande]